MRGKADIWDPSQHVTSSFLLYLFIFGEKKKLKTDTSSSKLWDHRFKSGFSHSCVSIYFVDPINCSHSTFLFGPSGTSLSHLTKYRFSGTSETTCNTCKTNGQKYTVHTLTFLQRELPNKFLSESIFSVFLTRLLFIYYFIFVVSKIKL
jgi:hypothetical protein